MHVCCINVSTNTWFPLFLFICMYVCMYVYVFIYTLYIYSIYILYIYTCCNSLIGTNASLCDGVARDGERDTRPHSSFSSNVRCSRLLHSLNAMFFIYCRSNSLYHEAMLNIRVYMHIQKKHWMNQINLKLNKAQLSS